MCALAFFIVFQPFTATASSTKSSFRIIDAQGRNLFSPFEDSKPDPRMKKLIEAWKHSPIPSCHASRDVILSDFAQDRIAFTGDTHLKRVQAISNVPGCSGGSVMTIAETCNFSDGGNGPACFFGFPQFDPNADPTLGAEDAGPACAANGTPCENFSACTVDTTGDPGDGGGGGGDDGGGDTPPGGGDTVDQPPPSD